MSLVKPVVNTIFKYSATNEGKMVDDTIFPDNLVLNKSLNTQNYKSPTEDCFQFSYLKISCFANRGMTLTVNFHPMTNIMEHTGSLFTGDLSYVGGKIPHVAKVFTVPANTYKFFVTPIIGEKVSYEITLNDTTEDERTYVRCCLTNSVVGIIEE